MLNDKIDDIRARTKAGNLPREERITEVDRAIEEYFAKTGNMPDDKALERLADLLLYEELTDAHPDKVAREEYPFFSESQFDERHRKEASFKLAEEQGADGRNHKPPVKRVRSNYENRLVDKKAKSRNKERKQIYTEFTKVQPVEVRKIGL